MGDVAVVQQAVEDGGGEDVVAEDLSPFSERFVARDDHRAAFVSAGDELEDHVGFGAIEWEVADFVDDEDCWCRNALKSSWLPNTKKLHGDQCPG